MTHARHRAYAAMELEREPAGRIYAIVSIAIGGLVYAPWIAEAAHSIAAVAGALRAALPL